MRITVYDEVSQPFDHESMNDPLGGSEVALIQLCEALSKRGHTVACFNRRGKPSASPNGVGYFPLEMFHDVSVDMDATIVSRTSRPPGFNGSRKMVVSATDAHAHADHGADHFVCVSEWQKAKLGMPNSVVIPPILGDHVFAHRGHEKISNGFIYASSVGKGLYETLAVWERLKRDGVVDGIELDVTTTGYDAPDRERVKSSGASWIGCHAPRHVAAFIACRRALLYVNVAPETFSVVTAIACATGTEPLVLVPEGHDPGALPERGVKIHRTYEELRDTVAKFIKSPIATNIQIVDHDECTEENVVKRWLELLQS